jgi:hypothetical protein
MCVFTCVWFDESWVYPTSGLIIAPKVIQYKVRKWFAVWWITGKTIGHIQFRFTFDDLTGGSCNRGCSGPWSLVGWSLFATSVTPSVAHIQPHWQLFLGFIDNPVSELPSKLIVAVASVALSIFYFSVVLFCIFWTITVPELIK